MKKQLMVAFLMLIAIGAKSQTLYTGLKRYTNASLATQLSDGLQTKLNSNGFLMAGYIPVVTSGNDDVFMIKVDVDANFNSTPGEFANSYQLQTGGTSCGASLFPETRCYGITVKETQVASSVNPLVPAALWYATASSYDSGCLFSGLDANGAVSTSAFYTFPSSATSPSKPLITESVTNPGTYFIAGSYINGTMRQMYVLHVDAAGTILWSKLYDAGATSSVEPRAIVESPYSGAGTGLAIVGLADLNNSVQKEGFFALLDYNSNGWVNIFNTYGDGTNSTDEFFSAITIASSSSPGSTGYVIGGYTEQNSANGRAWIMKIDPTGTVIWSTRAKPVRDPLAGEIVGVVERFSNVYGSYEYYAAATSAYGFMVLKFDNAGNYFTQAGNTGNEFYYQRTGPSITQTATPVSISYDDVVSVNDGIHIYGTDVNTGVSDFMLAQASFNGFGGSDFSGTPPCMNNLISTYPMNSANMFTGPSTINTPAYNIVPGPQSCVNFIFNQTPITTAINALCQYTNQLTSGGSLNKSNSITGFEDLTTDELKIGPNPVGNSKTIYLTSSFNDVQKIILLNQFGQTVKIWDTNAIRINNENSILDISDLSFNSGIYFLQVYSKQKPSITFKLMIN